MSQVKDRDKVPICRSCSFGHWSDDVNDKGFCIDCAKASIQERPEGYYWIEDKDHDPFIAYYGAGTGIDQLDSSKEVIQYGWEWDGYDSGDNLDEATLKVLSDKITL
jgi:hypothetical protein